MAGTTMGKEFGALQVLQMANESWCYPSELQHVVRASWLVCDIFTPLFADQEVLGTLNGSTLRVSETLEDAIPGIPENMSADQEAGGQPHGEARLPRRARGAGGGAPPRGAARRPAGEDDASGPRQAHHRQGGAAPPLHPGGPPPSPPRLTPPPGGPPPRTSAHRSA